MYDKTHDIIYKYMIKYHICRLDNKGSGGMTDTFT